MGVLRSIPDSWKVFLSDLQSGFSNFPIGDRLSELFGFQFASQRYTYITLPQSWASSSCLFYSRISAMLAGFPIRSCVDDLIIGGRDLREHDKNIRSVLKRLQEVGCHLNLSKAQISASKVSFLG